MYFGAVSRVSSGRFAGGPLWPRANVVLNWNRKQSVETAMRFMTAAGIACAYSGDPTRSARLRIGTSARAREPYSRKRRPFIGSRSHRDYAFWRTVITLRYKAIMSLTNDVIAAW